MSIKIGISSCLLGNNVRYDGGNKRNALIVDELGEQFTWFPICPETDSGLGIPREMIELRGDPGNPRLYAIESHQDKTEPLISFSQKSSEHLAQAMICGFIFKSKSPSCGLENVRVYDKSGMITGTSAGFFAKFLMDKFPQLPVTDELCLQNPRMRDSFIERVVHYQKLLLA
jgi:uncharacterized protein YbbK (DUF523 family)